MNDCALKSDRMSECALMLSELTVKECALISDRMSECALMLTESMVNDSVH